jgi:hypothetical protein
VQCRDRPRKELPVRHLPAACRGCLPVGGPCSVEVVHACKLMLEQSRVQHGPSTSLAKKQILKSVSGPCFFLLAFFRFEAGKEASPLRLMSKSVVEASAVKGTAWSVSESSYEARLEVRVGPMDLAPCLF